MITHARTDRLHYAWVVLAATTFVLLTSGGVRAAIGVFVKPLEAEFGWSRTELSFAVAISIALYVWAYEWVHDKHPTLALIIMIGLFVLACAAIFTERKVKTKIVEKREHHDNPGPVIDIKAEELTNTHGQ